MTAQGTGNEEYAPAIPSKDAVEYGRSVIGPKIDKYRRWERQAKAKGDEEQMLSWRRLANMLVRDLYGHDDGGCVIAAFDVRWLDDGFRDTMSSAFSRAAESKASASAY